MMLVKCLRFDTCARDVRGHCSRQWHAMYATWNFNALLSYFYDLIFMRVIYFFLFHEFLMYFQDIVIAGYSKRWSIFYSGLLEYLFRDVVRRIATTTNLLFICSCSNAYIKHIKIHSLRKNPLFSNPSRTIYMAI